jgi:hypothetical protein
MLADAHIRDFINDGFVRVDDAFPRDVAGACCAILWRDTGCDPNNRATWTRPVVCLGDRDQAPFVAAANAPRLRAALNQIVGKGRWQPRRSLGSFPIRFPGQDDPGDAGWHVDASFPGEGAADFLSYRINVRSRGRALLMLFLFSDVGERDAPTRIRIGSHRDVARILAPAGEAGLSFMELAERLDGTATRATAMATGAGGTVYLCHPFIVHAAQLHQGREPRFMAQPPLFPAEPLSIDRRNGAYSPVEQAIREALSHDTTARR